MNTYVALCAVGAEKILGNELKLLGYKLDGNAPGRVAFTGDDDALYRANYCLRTSDRVYLQMAKYKASDFDELFDGCYAVNWQDYFKKNVRVVVDKVSGTAFYIKGIVPRAAIDFVIIAAVNGNGIIAFAAVNITVADIVQDDGVVSFCVFVVISVNVVSRTAGHCNFIVVCIAADVVIVFGTYDNRIRTFAA